MKTLYIECNMGVAGDMLMGALYELCDQKEKFLSDMNQAFTPYGVTGSKMRDQRHTHEGSCTRGGRTFP